MSEDQGTGDDDVAQEEDEDSRRAIIWFIIVFVSVLFLLGGANLFGIISFGGTGELTVNVTDQNGQPVAGETVEILDPNTGNIIARGTTDEDGEAEFDLDQGDYDVRVGDSSQTTALREETSVDLTVDTSPPEPN